MTNVTIARDQLEDLLWFAERGDKALSKRLWRNWFRKVHVCAHSPRARLRVMPHIRRCTCAHRRGRVMSTTEPTPEAVEALARVVLPAMPNHCCGPDDMADCPWDAHDASGIARAVIAAGYVLLEPEAAVERVDKYTINIGAASITATADQERRIKEMTARQRVGLARMLGKKP